MKFGNFSLVMILAFVAFGFYCRTNAPVQAAIITPSEALDQVLPAPIKLPFIIPSAPAIAFVPPPEIVEQLEQECHEVEGILAMEAMEPQQLAEVYRRFIKLDNPKLDEETVMTVALAYAEEEFKYNLPKGLLVAIGYRESSQRPNVVSKAKAYGLMQVQVPTGFDAAKRLGQISKKAKPSDWKKYRTKLVAMLKDPRCNIELGSNTLSNYLRRSNGNLEKALAKYSNGAKDYSGKIIGRMRAIQAHIMK